MEAAGADSTSPRLGRNTLANALGFAWQGLVLLALTPYIVHRLGIELYGVWVVVNALVGYCDLADVTGKIALTKFVAQHHAAGDERALARALDNGALYYCTLIILLLALGTLARGPLLTLLRVPAVNHAEAATAFSWCLLAFCATAAGNLPAALLNGLQRMEVLNGVAMAVGALRVAATVLVLQTGWGLRGLACAEAALAFTLLLGSLAACKVVYAPLRLRPFAYHGPTMKAIVGFGAQYNVSSAAEIVTVGLDKLLLSRFVGVAAVSYYDLGARLLRYARSFAFMTISALAPRAAQLAAQGEHSRLVALYRRSGKLQAVAVCGGFGLLGLAAPNLIRLWVGPGYELSAWTMRVLCLGYGVHALTGAGFYISGGMGKAGYQLRSALLLAALNVVLSIALIRTFGYDGAPWGTSIAMICAAIYFVGSFGRSLGQPLRQLWREALWLPLAAAALGIALLTLAEWAVVHWAVHIGFVLGGRAAAAEAVLLQALGYSAVYFMVLRRAGYFGAAESAALRGLLPLRRRAKPPAAEAVSE